MKDFDAWDERWPDCRPIGHELKWRVTERWVRFHALPGSKRYPDTAEERAEILRRHGAVLEALGAAGSIYLLRAELSSDPSPEEDPQPTLARFDATWLRTCEEDQGEGEPPLYWHVFARVVAWRPGVLDEALLAVADEKLWNILLTPPDLGWIFYPYDGGADVFLPSRAARNRLSRRFRVWLSPREDGL
ncbi:MAG: DUF3885 domain-containing protein [Myxococcota bacterium]